MLDPDFIAAVAHPVRVRALVLLEGGSLSTSQLAAELDLRTEAMGYHVQRMRDAGLIHQVGTRSAKGREHPVWTARGTGWKQLERRLAAISKSLDDAD